MRKPRRDELWDRTPGGLFIPSRVALPTRRYIGKLGMVKDCCAQPSPCTFCGSLDSEYDVTLSGFADSVTDFSETCGDLVVSGCDCLNSTFRLPWVGQNNVVATNRECDGAWDLGCRWEQYFEDCSMTFSYDPVGCRGTVQGPYVHLWVKNGSSAGLIDVEVHVVFWLQNHLYRTTGVTCQAGCLDGLQVPACGSSNYLTRGPAGCAESGVSGYATIDAVA